jgi:hypothetical protein
VPTVAKAGGFTLTSTPARARAPGPAGYRYLELAVQRSPDNPPAAWLWQDPSPPTHSDDNDDEDAPPLPPSRVVDQPLRVRVGGSFVWPPPALAALQAGAGIGRVVFVAGGVGVNPLVSMVCDMAEQKGWKGWVGARRRGEEEEEEEEEGDDDDDESVPPFDVRFLYSMRDPGGERGADGMLFVERLVSLFVRERVRGELHLFLTPSSKNGEEKEEGGSSVVSCNEVDVPFLPRRIGRTDLEEALGKSPEEHKDAVAYICGLPGMTDEIVRDLTAKEEDGGMGMSPDRVYCEKWW